MNLNKIKNEPGQSSRSSRGPSDVKYRPSYQSSYSSGFPTTSSYSPFSMTRRNYGSYTRRENFSYSYRNSWPKSESWKYRDYSNDYQFGGMSGNKRPWNGGGGGWKKKNFTPKTAGPAQTVKIKFENGGLVCTFPYHAETINCIKVSSLFI